MEKATELNPITEADIQAMRVLPKHEKSYNAIVPAWHYYQLLKEKQDMQKDINLVLTFLEGKCKRKEIINFVKEYLIK